MTEVKFVNKSGSPEPFYQTEHSAGMDLRAHLEGEIILKPGERKLVKTGLFIELPEGFEAQVRSRSGMALKSGVAVLNSPGTIDADYRGEIGVILINHSDQDFEIKNGDRIAQMVIARYERVDLVRMNELTETSRGAGGFGHTGNI